MNIREEVVSKLLATKKWSERTAELGERANYRCEYCGMDLLGSVESYKLWQVDHIVPISAGGDSNSKNNLAIACRQCNMDLKRDWDPRKDAGPNAKREKLIKSIIRHIEMQKSKTFKELQIVWEIVDYKNL